MYRSRRELLLLGDFNMDMTNDESVGRRADSNLTDFCDKFCLDNQIKEPTRVTENTKTLIDVMLASHPERYATCGTLDLGVSDHVLIYAVRKNKLPRPKPHKIEYRSMKRFSEKDFLADLNNVPWDSAYIFDNVDDQWDHWAKLYNEVLDKHAPLKKSTSEVINYHGLHHNYSERFLFEIVCLSYTKETHHSHPGRCLRNRGTRLSH